MRRSWSQSQSSPSESLPALHGDPDNSGAGAAGASGLFSHLTDAASRNATSQFKPLLDSMRIYLVLLRFTIISLITAGIDNLVFWLLFHSTGNTLESQIGGRVLAVSFNYVAVRWAVFLSHEKNKILLPRYLLVVVSNLALSYTGIEALTRISTLSVYAAKIVAESVLFLVNFCLLRDFVFTNETRKEVDEWCGSETGGPEKSNSPKRRSTHH